MNIWAILLAAGQSSRLQSQGQEQKKQFILYQGLPLYWQSLISFAQSAKVQGVVIAFPPLELQSYNEQLTELEDQHSLGIPLQSVAGGSSRQESVYNALQALPRECTHVLVHDAARPFFSPGLIHSLVQAHVENLGGVIPGIPCKDTIKELSPEKLVIDTLPRDQLIAVQTPQFFCKDLLLRVHEQAKEQGFSVTDDAAMLERFSYKVKVVSGEETNLKITTSEDLKVLETNAHSAYPCTGFGYDVHRFGGPKALVLGGVPIPGAPGIYSHSDGDVLIHALVDAILGCLGQGDIGDLYPDSDPENEDLSSSIFLNEVLHLAQAQNLLITNIDVTIIAQTPKLAPHKHTIRSNLMGLTGLESQRINIKATTEEGLGFTGAKQGIKAVVMVSAVKYLDAKN